MTGETPQAIKQNLCACARFPIEIPLVSSPTSSAFLHAVQMPEYIRVADIADLPPNLNPPGHRVWAGGRNAWVYSGTENRRSSLPRRDPLRLLDWRQFLLPPLRWLSRSSWSYSIRSGISTSTGMWRLPAWTRWPISSPTAKPRDGTRTRPSRPACTAKPTWKANLTCVLEYGALFEVDMAD